MATRYPRATRDVPVVILGAGLAGMSTGLNLASDFLIVEKERSAGGHCTTEERDGFLFDKTGHWLHVVRPETIAMVTRLTRGGFSIVNRRATIHSHDVHTLYPFQSNTHGLPLPVVKECIAGFIEATRGAGRERKVATFHDYILRHFGAGIARHFMVPYNRKLWTVHPRAMGSEWCEGYVPRPTLDEILDGALGRPDRPVGYNATFRYPKRGGIGVMTDGLFASVGDRVALGVRPVSIDTARRLVRLDNGESLHYRHLVSTIPLPELVRVLEDVPSAVRDAARTLRWTSVLYLNVALDRPVPVDVHWTYFPEPEFPFYRAGSPSNAAPWTVPPGSGSLYVEVSARAPGDLERLRLEILAGLSRSGMIGSRRHVVFSYFGLMKYGYVIFNRSHRTATGTIFRHLKARGIRSAGRYGRWTYNGMRDALEDGVAAAQAINNQL